MRSPARPGFVISEHAGGLQPERLERFKRADDRLASVAAASIEVVHYSEIEALDVDAIVLSGSFDPWASHDPRALDRLGEALRAHDGPVLGICAGMQTLVRAAGGEISAAEQPTAEGFATIDIVDGSDLLSGLEPRIDVFQHHTDEISALPDKFRVLASSEAGAVEAVAAEDRPWWGTQLHPEMWNDEHPRGRVVVENFLRLAGIGVR